MCTSLPLRVLLVEDSTLLAARLAELIRQLADVELTDVVATEAEALEREATTSPDVIILDLHLRAGSGFGVLRALARRGRRPRVVILTNFGLAEYRRQAEAFGVDAFLDKSRDYHRLPALLSGFASLRSAG
jgi:DNA-binding NarL/FixJ family response regulator